MPAPRYLLPVALAVPAALVFCAVFGTRAECRPAQGQTLGLQYRYTVTDLGEATGGPVSLNNLGDVLIAPKEAGGNNYSRLWRKGVETRLPARGFVATDLNDKGAIVGYAPLGRDDKGLPIFHAAILQGTRLRDLTPQDSVETRAVSINHAGWIVISGFQGQLYSGPGSEVHELGRSEAAVDPFLPVELNDAGQIAGNQGPDALLWQDGEWDELERQPEHDTAVVKGLNKGFACGYGTSDAGENVYALKWQGTQLIPLDPYGPDFGTVALSINQRGSVVGYALKQGTFPALSGESAGSSAGSLCALTPRMDAGVSAQRACLWVGSKNYDLNRTLPRGTPWLLRSAYEINARGQIVGEGLFKGKPHYFLLNPVR